MKTTHTILAILMFCALLSINTKAQDNQNSNLETIELSAAELLKYQAVYRYEFEDKNRTLHVKDDTLYWQNPSGLLLKLLPKSKTDFCFEYDNNTTLTFEFENNGEIKGLTFDNTESNKFYNRTTLEVKKLKQAAVISDKAFDAILGNYRAYGSTIVLSRKGNELHFYNKMQGTWVFLPESEKVFFKEKEENFIMKFRSDDKGNITGFVIDMPGYKVKATRK